MSCTIMRSRDKECTVGQWTGIQVCIVASNVDSVDLAQTYRRYQMLVERTFDSQWTNWRCGQVNQNIHNCGIGIRRKMLWMPIYTFLMDHAWQLYRLPFHNSIDLFVFRRYVTQAYLLKFNLKKSVSSPHTLNKGRPKAVDSAFNLKFSNWQKKKSLWRNQQNTDDVFTEKNGQSVCVCVLYKCQVGFNESYFATIIRGGRSNDSTTEQESSKSQDVHAMMKKKGLLKT